MNSSVLILMVARPVRCLTMSSPLSGPPSTRLKVDPVPFRDQFHLREGQEPEALSDVLRDGDLAFPCDPHDLLLDGGNTRLKLTTPSTLALRCLHCPTLRPCLCQARSHRLPADPQPAHRSLVPILATSTARSIRRHLPDSAPCAGSGRARREASPLRATPAPRYTRTSPEMPRRAPTARSPP